MAGPFRLKLLALLAVALGGCIAPTTCPEQTDAAGSPLPRELQKVSLPDYFVEPPDILLIDALRVTPKPPYHIAAGDAVLVQYTGETFPGETPGWDLHGGPRWGHQPWPVLWRFRPGDRPDAQAGAGGSSDAPEEDHQTGRSQGWPGDSVTGPIARLAADPRRTLGAPDGTVSLGTYGKVRVTGMTLDETKEAIEDHLSR